MGSILGFLTGSKAATQGGQITAAGDEVAANTALQGYNYLTAANGGAPSVGQSVAAGIAGSQQEQTLQGQVQALLGASGTTPAQQAQARTAYNNYLNSTGYQFQMGQGQQAITGSASAAGLLGSGSDAKALTQYGQGLAANSFNNYITQLTGANTAATTTANQGTAALNMVGQAGTAGGGNAASALSAGAAAQGNAAATAGALNAGLFSGLMGSGSSGATNYLSGIGGGASGGGSSAVAGVPGTFQAISSGAF